MNWLAQNWVWVALGLAAAFFFFRGSFGGRGAGQGGLIGGMGFGGGCGGGGGGGAGDERPERGAANAPDAALDAVSGEAVRTGQALTSLYQGKIYYFASKENRDRFEAAPQDYAAKATGYPVQAPASEPSRPRRRGGC